ncbi:MAG TPA: response regulator transcription factor [Anaerolineales bacterium]|nr:response regulator transcription factor [Anaerolineales bacterium]
MKTIFLGESERHVLDALWLLLDEQTDFEIVGEAQTAEVLLTQVSKYEPDVILFDWNMPGLHPQRFIPALRESCPSAKLLATSVKPEDEKIVKKFNLDLFISKQLPPDEFLKLLKDNTDFKENV